MRQQHKSLSLIPKERQLLVEAFALLGAIKFGLWLLPFSVLRRRLATINQTNFKPDNAFTIDQIVEAVNRSNYYLPGDTNCLAKALVTQLLMLQYGHSSKLRIGVAKDEKGQFEAHAWVESQDQIVIGNLTDLERYTPMPSLAGG